MTINNAYGGDPKNTSRFDLEAAMDLVRRSDGRLVPGLKFGFNGAVGKTPEGIHSMGGPIFFPQSAQPVRVRAGGDVADTALGAGARSILVTGIDDNLDAAEETIVTNGPGASAPTTTLFWRVSRLEVVGVGTYGGANVGTITVENTTDLQALVEVPVGAGQSQTSLVSTPRKRPMVITALTLQVGSVGKVVEFNLYIREAFNEVSAPCTSRKARFGLMKVATGVWPIPWDAPIPVPELTDVWVEASVSSSTAEVGSLMSYYTVPTS